MLNICIKKLDSNTSSAVLSHPSPYPGVSVDEATSMFKPPNFEVTSRMFPGWRRNNVIDDHFRLLERTSSDICGTFCAILN